MDEEEAVDIGELPDEAESSWGLDGVDVSEYNPDELPSELSDELSPYLASDEPTPEDETEMIVFENAISKVTLKATERVRSPLSAPESPPAPGKDDRSDSTVQ